MHDIVQALQLLLVRNLDSLSKDFFASVGVKSGIELISTELYAVY